MKKLEDIYKKFTIRPNTSLMCGVIYEGEDIDLCDDYDTGDDYDIHVEQKIISGKLETKLEREITMKNGKVIKEKSEQQVELEEGQILIYVEGLGFSIPNTKVCTIQEAIGLYDILKGEEDELTGNEKESAEINRGN